MNIERKLAEEFNIRASQVESTVKLIDEGNTIPFIARYRKEATGGLTDVTLRDLSDRLTYLRGLEERKEEVKKAIAEQGKLTGELSKEIDKAEILQRVEDLYKPFKQKKATRASKARAKGLEPLAMIVQMQQQKNGSLEEICERYVDPEKEVETPQEALQGACDILAELYADDADLTEEIREKTYNTGKIATEAVDPEESTVYDMYYGSSEPVSKMPNHRILAVNRGEKEKKLKVKVDVDESRITGLIERKEIRGQSIFTEILKATVADS